MNNAIRRVSIRNPGLILGLIFTLAQCLSAQTPTLVRSAAHVGIASNFFDSASTYTFQMEPNGSPRGVAAGDTIIFFGTWPSGRPQTFTDNTGSNTWNASFSPATSCQDSVGSQHGFFYASNVSAGTSLVTESSTGTFQDTVMDFAYFANMATSGALDGSSCASAVTPANNNVPNITGTPFTTTTAGDLIITCVYDVHHPLGVGSPWTSIAYPANFTGLSEEVRFGHACALLGAANGWDIHADVYGIAVVARHLRDHIRCVQGWDWRVAGRARTIACNFGDGLRLRPGNDDRESPVPSKYDQHHGDERSRERRGRFRISH